uniref:alpha-1,2-Mannosidase n=1 Tax=Odontella aurita TaxID=265563 RepID=A0A7S4N8K7_9STRA
MFPPDNVGKDDYPAKYMSPPVPSSGHDFSSYRPLGGDRFVEWKDGETPYAITPALLKQSDDLARSRRDYVKKAMEHAWSGYKKHAFGQDEVLPQSGKSHSNWGGMGTTLVDSLDTLWLMGMKEEFTQARDWVRDHLDHDHVHKSISVFETTIRSLGGLLSAYDWSGDKAFLDKANDLGARLFKSFQSPSGIPFGSVNINDGRASNFGWAGNNAILSEFTTIQVEYRYLARATGKKEYADKAERVYELMKEIEPSNGLYPLYVRNTGEKPSFANQKISFGAMGDSFYEYMLKIWLQGGKKESMYREMYDRSIQGMHDELLFKSTPTGLTYIADKVSGRVDHKMDHLVCFMGGLLALGAYTDPQGFDSTRAQRDLKTAKELTYTCYQMYARMKTGISPEFVAFGKDSNDFTVGHNAAFYILRPETVESFFVLNQLTGDPAYREWGWEVFQSIERYCRTDIAYGSLTNVNNPGAAPEDRMESFFLAETIKYLYLLFDPDTEVDIVNKHVFNTEAHPMRILPEFDKSPLALK